MVYYSGKKKQSLHSHPVAYGTLRLITLVFVRGVFVCGGLCFPHFLFYIWRCLAISTKELQINEEIKVKEARIVGPEGEQLGIMKVNDALEAAYEKGFDLVLIAPQATPPVCRIMDYGKFRFERAKKEKEAKKKQQVIEVKEVQLSCRIDTHDFNTKVNHAHRFLSDGNKVRVIVKFRGREMTHLDLGREILEKFEEACAEIGNAEKKPMLEGRFMSMILAPLKADKK